MNILFIEGISGVGKSTLTRNLAKALSGNGTSVRAYEEFDINPIDFCNTAYLTDTDYRMLCRAHPALSEVLEKNTVPAGAARLVRYYDRDTPLFSGDVLAYLREHEFCWKPKFPVSREAYTDAYHCVWQDFAAANRNTQNVFLFDGALLHHPINDMLRNYRADEETVLSHVKTLLSALDGIPRRIVYLETRNIARSLTAAHCDRGQHPPTDAQIAFWETRYRYDRYVLGKLAENVQRFDVTDGGWEDVREYLVSAETECMKK